MTLPLPPITNPEWWKGPNSFRLIYLLLTIATSVGTAWAVKRGAAPIAEWDEKSAVEGPAERFLSASTIAALSLVVLIFAGYATLVLKWEDFADYDDSFFTLITLRGHNLQPPVWPGSGRFFPLARQEFNLVRHFTRSVVGYHIVPISELLIVCCIVFLLEEALKYPARLALIATLLLTPSIVISFTGLVFPEIDFVLWLTCLLLFVKLFEKRHATVWAVAAAVSAQNMVYYKETAFLLLLGFAVGRLFVRCRRKDGKGWDFDRLRDKESRLDFCFVCVALLFVVYYAAVMMSHWNLRYSNLFGLSRGETLLYYLELDPLAVLLVAAVLYRFYLIVVRGAEPLPYWDGLAIGGVTCYAAYLYLRLCMPYYLAPVDFIAVLYIGRLVIPSWERMKWWHRAGVSAILCAVLSYNVTLSAFRVYERENDLHAKAEIADAILVQARKDATHVQTLFIPFSTSYIITQYAAYLTYRGIHVEGYDGALRADAANQVTIARSDFTPDDPCNSYTDFVCHTKADPSAGDLIIELPDGPESQSDIDRYTAGGERVFSYEPRPRVVQRISPWLPYLGVISYRWPAYPPDRWLKASVTIGK